MMADLTGTDDATKALAVVVMLLADEADRLAGVLDRVVRRVR